MAAEESEAERPSCEVFDRPENLEARWEHWRVSVEAAEPNVLVAKVPVGNLLQVLGDARDSEGPGFRRLVDLTAVDHRLDYDVDSGGSRFELVYWLSRPTGGTSLRVRAGLVTESEAASGEGLEVDSAVRLWPSANWLEREVFDLFGIGFRGHPDLRRLLLPADFEGAPLRKDYPRQPNLPLPKPLEASQGAVERGSR